MTHTPLISPSHLKNKLPLSEKQKAQIDHFRLQAKNILTGKDERLVMIIGPCSIHNRQLTMEYAACFKKLADQVKDHIFLIMRVFLEKARTQYGWKGLIYDPYLDESHALEAGLFLSRELLLNLVELNVPLATEFLDPFLSPYHAEFFTWGIIGARTAASQIHRQMASQFTFPIGFKNETDGTLDNAVHGALAAQMPQATTSISPSGNICMIKSQGNPWTHTVLRGSTHATNYDPLAVFSAIHKQRLLGLNARLLIDCAHGNCQKQARKQLNAFQTVLTQILEGNHLIMGMMLESHLEENNQTSITDPCLDWETTQHIVLETYHAMPPLSETLFSI